MAPHAFFAAVVAVSFSAAVVIAQSASPACNLNGVYNSGNDTCSCFAPWVSTNCSDLDLLPVTFPSGYGYSPNVSSWGGNVVFANGLFHMYVAEVQESCPLTQWETNSACIHAVASSFEGPFVREGIAVPIWCHNPQVVEFIDTNGDTMFALFHIGTGTGGDPKNCSSSLIDSDGATPSLQQGSSNASTIHIASNPAGPWNPVLPPPPPCNNVAPLFHSGAWYILCDSITIYQAPTFTGPWVEFATLTPPPGRSPFGAYEDGFLYIDERGNWHALFHVWSNDKNVSSCVGTTVSAHAFSTDGVVWSFTPMQPYGATVALASGGNLQLSTRERPKIGFDSNGRPAYLYTGVCASQACPSNGWWCSHCKQLGYWTFTLAQGLRIA